MKGNLHLYYDEEGDFLELQVGEPREGYFEEIEKGIFERKDKKGLRDISLPVKVELTA